MAIATENRWKETAQCVLVAVVVLLLLWFCRPGLFRRDASVGGGDGLSAFALASDSASFQDDDESCDECEQAWETDYPDIMSMPVCSDLRGAIRELQDARTNLLKVAADGESEAVLAAAARYGEVLQKVRGSYKKLKLRVVPDDFSSVVEELIGFCNTDEQQVMAPFELKHLEQDHWQ